MCPDRFPAAITAAYRRPETEAVSMLLEQARLQPVMNSTNWRINWPISCVIKKKTSGRAGIVQGYCRIFVVIARLTDVSGGSVVAYSDKATRDALIRDKINGINWRSHWS